MPRTLWSGLPDATCPETSISLGAVRSRFRPVADRDEGTGGTAALCIRVV
jgi:hypothetical protein